MSAHRRKRLVPTALACVAFSAPVALAQSSLPWQKPGNIQPIREPATGGGVNSVAVDGNVQSFSGKLNVEINGNPHYCSGVFVDPQVIVTAAHCVQQNGTTIKYTVVKFVREGGEEFTLKGACIQVPVEWTTQTDEYLRINYDYAFLKLDHSVTGLKVQLVATDPYDRPIKSHGYPAPASTLTAISADATRDLLHPKVVGLVTDSLGFTAGTSGGAWVWDRGSGHAQQFKVVSVNSSYAFPVYDKSKIWIYGPNFNRPKEGTEAQSAQQILTNVVGC